MIDRVAGAWVARDLGLDAPDLALADIARLDREVDAALERVDDAACDEGMRDGKPGAFFAAAVIAIRARDRSRLDRVIADGLRDAAYFRGVESALGWCELGDVREAVGRLLEADSSDLRRVEIAAFAVQRCDPGRALDLAVTHEHVPLRARAVKAVWQLGRRDLLPAIRASFRDPDLATRFSACWAGALARDAEGITALQGFAERGDRYPDRAVQLAGLAMEPGAARAWHRSLGDGLAILGAATLADPADVPWLLGRLHDPVHGRAAGETLTTITGIDLARQRPAEWWARESARFEPGVRTMLGEPITPALLRRILKSGLVRHRTLVATELALVEGGPSYEVRAPGYRQQRELSRTGQGST